MSDGPTRRRANVSTVRLVAEFGTANVTIVTTLVFYGILRRVFIEPFGSPAHTLPLRSQ